MGSAYLAAYNGILAAGWSYCLFLVIQTAMVGGSTTEAWEVLQQPLKIFQTAALMEVLHSAFGLVRSPVMVTALQVASRIFVLWGILVPLPEETATQAVHLITVGTISVDLNIFTLVAAWSVSEVIRYGYFAFKELGVEFYLAKWLRYTGFIVLYPVGVSSELAMVFLALPTIKASRMWSIDMPNTYNFAFDYHI
ncbi:unnamed protein product, partial [Ostreobium quekettii]